MREATTDINNKCEIWEALIGGLIGRDSMPIPFCDVGTTKECCREYGQGRCAHDLLPVGVASVKIHKRTLWAISRIPTAKCEGVQKIKLVLFQPRLGLAPLLVPGHQPRLVLMPFALYNPVTQVYWNCEVTSDGPVQPGSIVAAQRSLNAFMTDARMAQWMMQQPGGIIINHLTYRFISLSQMEILDCEDVTDAAQRLAAGTKLEEETELLKRVCR